MEKCFRYVDRSASCDHYSEWINFSHYCLFVCFRQISVFSVARKILVSHYLKAAACWTTVSVLYRASHCSVVLWNSYQGLPVLLSMVFQIVFNCQIRSEYPLCFYSIYDELSQLTEDIPLLSHSKGDCSSKGAETEGLYIVFMRVFFRLIYFFVKKRKNGEMQFIKL